MTWRKSSKASPSESVPVFKSRSRLRSSTVRLRNRESIWKPLSAISYLLAYFDAAALLNAANFRANMDSVAAFYKAEFRLSLSNWKCRDSSLNTEKCGNYKHEKAPLRHFLFWERASASRVCWRA